MLPPRGLSRGKPRGFYALRCATSLLYNCKCFPANPMQDINA